MAGINSKKKYGKNIVKETVLSAEQEIKYHQKGIVEIQQNLIDRILSLPDNPRIKRLSENPNCFIASSSDVFKSGNLSPEHHDFKEQYNLIVAKIKKSSPSRCFEVLRHIIFGEVAHFQGKPFIRNAGKITGGETPGRNIYYVNLHPDVISNLKEVLKECSE